MLLPPLHGLVSAFDDADTQSLEVLPSDDLQELREAFYKLDAHLSRLTGQSRPIPALRDGPDTSQNAFGRLLGHGAETSTKQLRPPSPERRQCRKQSHGDY
ncbi:hypothetical protein K439DRAFT_1611779 [Ramaria rubella]|nr:hypothetical protein K439DRAFT_1611779 [Ramaria rubella]